MRPSKNQLRRARKKALKSQATEATLDESHTKSQTEVTLSTDVSRGSSQQGHDAASLDLEDPLWQAYKHIINRFDEVGDTSTPAKESEKPEIYFDDDDEIPDEEEKEPKLSKRKRKELNKLSVAELKAMVRRPEIVEWTDTSAPDPRLLVHIKSHRNVVPVPSHWSLKREYLSSKRGIEKPPFALPKFIQETGISEMRDAALEKQEQATLKQKQRERVQPKMGRLDIDYQKLYEAFFRFQTKPELTRYGEVYYEALNMPPAQDHSPPSGPSHGPKSLSSQTRSSNISLLSAPTRPRGGPSFKENVWTGAPARRGPMSAGSYGPPTGPRSGHTLMPGPGVDTHRHSTYRQGSVTGVSYPRTPRYMNHLTGLSSIISGGRCLPSDLDALTEKRLSQLDADRDRLMEQIADTQRSKRVGIRDWDRLDRDSSICALKSELAEGHLQRIADGESAHVSAIF
ncbi:hypothetical protein AFLA_012084 [Aspergillus flavus NRRL3357]|nr:hypothetical protein AFLA_012084 [Aspergillus flavus NRRL3357]